MRNYCTLFDKNYLTKGLAMYESLKRHSSEDFTLSVLPLDRETDDILTALKLPNLIVLAALAFEHDQQLEKIKETRNRQHYAWTCASNLCEWLLFCPDCELAEISYIDADCYWMADPEIIFDEIGDRSIAIVPHRLIPEKKYLEATSGLFNVGFVYFRNDPVGRECLSTWAAQVRERCDASTCGDQKFLDSWPDIYGSECHVVGNIGANTAPWNLANWRVTEGPCVDGVPIIFHHFHEYEHGKRLTNYELRSEDIELIYKPYIKAINQAQLSIVGIHA